MAYVSTAERVGVAKGYKQGVEQSMAYVSTAERVGIAKGYKQGVEQSMTYVSSAERVGIEKGFKQGLEQGIERGIEQGQKKGEILLLIRQLTRKFGAISPSYLKQIYEADAKTLLLLGERILDAKKLLDVFSEEETQP